MLKKIEDAPIQIKKEDEKRANWIEKLIQADKNAQKELKCRIAEDNNKYYLYKVTPISKQKFKLIVIDKYDNNIKGECKINYNYKGITRVENLDTLFRIAGNKTPIALTYECEIIKADEYDILTEITCVGNYENELKNINKEIIIDSNYLKSNKGIVIFYIEPEVFLQTQYLLFNISFF